MQGTLKHVIRGMLKDARAVPGRPVSRSLGGVITVEIKQLENGRVHLTLSRRNTAPTDESWGRILEQWPEAVPEEIVPRPHKEGRTYTLSADWPRPAETEAA